MKKTLCSLVLFLSVFTTNTVADAGVVAWYRFENGTDNSYFPTSILDSSGNGLDGISINNPVYRSVTSVPHSTLAMEFNGSNQRIFISDDPKFQLTHSLTLEAFVRLSTYPSGPTWPDSLAQIVFRGDNWGGLDPYYLAILSDGRVIFSICGGSDIYQQIRSAAPLSVGDWHHVAATLDDATGDMKIYVDGALGGSLLGTTVRPFQFLGGLQ